MIRQFDWLVDWNFNGTIYRYSRFQDRTVSGNAYQNRILEIDGLAGLYIDRKFADFPRLNLTLCNLADDGSTDFPFHAINSIDDFEDKPLEVYLYDVVSNTKRLVWYGISTRPDFDPNEYTCSFEGTYIWDSVDITLPSKKLLHLCQYRFNGSSYETAGGTVPSIGCPYNPGGGIGTGSFTSCAKTFGDCTERGMTAYFGGWTRIAPVLKDEPNNYVDRQEIRSGCVPLIYGLGDLKIKPEIYRAVIIEQELIVNGLISGCHKDLPFDADQLTAHRLKLADVTRASWAKFWIGEQPQAIPGNRTIFPEAAGHSLVAYFAARFPLTKDQIEKYSNNVPYHVVSAKIEDGRKILRTDEPTESPVYVLEDVLRDKVFGLGIPASHFDDDSIEDTHTIIQSRFHGRFEIDEPEPAIDFLQSHLGMWHGYIGWGQNGKIYFGAKTDEEVSVATFGGEEGYKIIDHDAVECEEKDFSELLNDLVVKYRTKLRVKHAFAYADKGAQIKAGNGIEKPVTEEIFLPGIYDDDEAAISAAIRLREELNGNLFIQFRTPLDDWWQANPKCGDIITVISPHVWNNEENTEFRVVGYEYDTEEFEVTVQCQVYKTAIYAYNADPINGDILRTGGETNTHARPPDVEGCTAEITDVFTDDDGRSVNVHCTWEYPDVSVDKAEDEAEGVYTEYPIEAVDLYWQYTDLKRNAMHKSTRVRYPTAEADILIPFHKGRVCTVWFVAIGKGDGHGTIGYIADPNRATHLDGTIDDETPTIAVDDESYFLVDDYALCQNEIMLVTAVAAGELTVEDDAGDRVAQLDTSTDAHEDGTEIAVAVRSHPTVDVDMRIKRFTLGIVQNVILRRRRQGIRVKWDDLDPEQLERYLIYWTLDPDALNEPDLEPYAPFWYLDDPLNPPGPGGVIITPGVPGSGALYFEDPFEAAVFDGSTTINSDDFADPFAEADAISGDRWVELRNSHYFLITNDPGDDSLRIWDGSGVSPDPIIKPDALALLRNVPGVTTNFVITSRIDAQISNGWLYDQGGWELITHYYPATGRHISVRLRDSFTPGSPAGWANLIVAHHASDLYFQFSDSRYYLSNTNYGFTFGQLIQVRCYPISVPGYSGDVMVLARWQIGSVPEPDPDHPAAEWVDLTPEVRIGNRSAIDPDGTWYGVAQTGCTNSQHLNYNPPYGNSNEWGFYKFESFDYEEGTPPVTNVYGINLIKNKDLRVMIHWEDIVAAGGDDLSMIYVRVAAKIKRNFSSALSDLGERKHSRGPLCTPPTPTLGAITLNSSDGQGGAVVGITLTPCDGLTWDEADVEKVIFKFRDPADPTNADKKRRKVIEIDDEIGDQTTYEFLTEWKRAVGTMEHYKTVYRNSDGRRVSLAATGVEFTIGNFRAADPTGTSGEGAENLVLAAADPTSGLSIVCVMSFDQNADPSLPVQLKIEEKVSSAGDGTYVVKHVEALSDISLDDTGDPLIDPGAHTITRVITASDYDETYTYRATLIFGDGELVDTDNATTPNSTSVPPPSGSFSINDASDVDTATTPPTDGQAMLWVAADGQWKPGDVAAGGEAGDTIGVLVTKSGTQAIADNTTTSLTFDTETRDDAGFHSTSSNTERLTVPVGQAGWYVIAGQVAWEAIANTVRRVLIIRKNGSTQLAEATWLPYSHASTTSTHQVSASVYLAEGDYVELRVYQNTGGSLNVATAGVAPTCFGMIRQGPGATSLEAEFTPTRLEWHAPSASTTPQLVRQGAGTAGGTAAAATDATGPMITYTTGTVSGNSSGYIGSGNHQAGPLWEPKAFGWVRSGGTITSYRFWVGLTEAELAATSSPTTLSVAAFRYATDVDGTAFWRCVTGGGSALTTTTTTVAFTTNTNYKLLIDFNSAGTEVKFYINGMLVATHTTNLPNIGQSLLWLMRLTTLTGAARAFGARRFMVEYN